LKILPLISFLEDKDVSKQNKFEFKVTKMREINGVVGYIQRDFTDFDQN
jgi:hypothetical protein